MTGQNMLRVGIGVIIPEATTIAYIARKHAITIRTAVVLNVGVLYNIAVGGRMEIALQHWRKL